jgi:hypothetical protein
MILIFLMYSKLHAALICTEAGDVWLCDLSQNGTLVKRTPNAEGKNGGYQQLQKRACTLLGDDCTVRIGSVFVNGSMKPATSSEFEIRLEKDQACEKSSEDKSCESPSRSRYEPDVVSIFLRV